MATEESANGTPASGDNYQADLAARLAQAAEATDEEAGEGEADADADKSEGDEAADDAGDGEADADAEAEADEGTEEKADDEPAEDDKPLDKDALRKLQKQARQQEAYLRSEKNKIAAERAQLDSHTTKLNQEIDKLNKAVESFLDDPFTFLEERGMLAEEAAHLAWQLRLAYDDKVTKDPKAKAEAERIRKDRQERQNRKAMQDRIQKMEEDRLAEKAEQAAAQQLESYVTKLDASVELHKAKTPLLVKALAKDPASTKRELYQVAYDLAKAGDGQFVEPSKVLMAWEKSQRERLARLGISLPAETAPDASRAKTPLPEKPGQKPNKKAASAKEQPAVAKSEEDYQAELRRRLNQ